MSGTGNLMVNTPLGAGTATCPSVPARGSGAPAVASSRTARTTQHVRGAGNTPLPLNPLIAQRSVEVEVAICVGGVTATRTEPVAVLLTPGRLLSVRLSVL